MSGSEGEHGGVFDTTPERQTIEPTAFRYLVQYVVILEPVSTTGGGRGIHSVARALLTRLYRSATRPDGDAVPTTARTRTILSRILSLILLLICLVDKKVLQKSRKGVFVNIALLAG